MKANLQAIDVRRRRIQAILQIRLDGAEPWDVRQFIAEKEQAGEEPWTIEDGQAPLTAAQVRAIIKAADALIAESYPDDAPDIARHKAKLKNLYARAVQAADVRTARSILNDLAKLDGLNRRGKPAASTVPSKARAATEKLRARIAKGKEQ